MTMSCAMQNNNYDTDAETLFSVGRRFLTGSGVEKDTARARELLGQAAELGHSLAKQLLETIPQAKPAEVATVEEPAAALPAPGYYRHFKGNYYYLVELASHSETLEPMVVYRALYGEHKLWVRPATMWSEIVDKPEYHGPRFVAVAEDEVPEDSRLK